MGLRATQQATLTGLGPRALPAPSVGGGRAAGARRGGDSRGSRTVSRIASRSPLLWGAALCTPYARQPPGPLSRRGPLVGRSGVLRGCCSAGPGVHGRLLARGSPSLAPALRLLHVLARCCPGHSATTHGGLGWQLALVLLLPPVSRDGGRQRGQQ